MSSDHVLNELFYMLYLLLLHIYEITYVLGWFRTDACGMICCQLTPTTLYHWATEDYNNNNNNNNNNNDLLEKDGGTKNCIYKD